MRFSIIIPIYNAASRLCECLDAALYGMRAGDELLLVDDGSTDGSGEIIDRYAAAHPQIRVIHTENQGPLLARREGIRRADGDFCLFSDADDRMAEDCLSTVRERLLASDADILLYNYAVESEDGAVRVPPPVFEDGRIFEGEEKRVIYREIAAGWRLNSLCEKAVRTRLLQEDDTDFTAYADMTLGEDLLASLYPVTHAKRIAYCEKPLYRYLRLGGGLTRAFDEKQRRSALDARMPMMLRRCLALWNMEDAASLAVFHRRLLAARIDDCMSFFRHAADADAQRGVLSTDWFSGLPLTAEEQRKAAASLPLKQRVQYELIRKRQTGLLRLLLRRGANSAAVGS